MPATAARCGRAPASRRAAINTSAAVRTLTTAANMDGRKVLRPYGGAGLKSLRFVPGRGADCQRGSHGAVLLVLLGIGPSKRASAGLLRGRSPRQLGGRMPPPVVHSANLTSP